MVTHALYRGPAHVCIAVCDEFRERVGNFTGVPVREQFPELVGFGVFEAMDTVYLTGEPVELAWPSISDGTWGALLILPWYRDGTVAGVGVHHFPVVPATPRPRIAAQA